MLTALDIFNLVLASKADGEALIDPYTGEILDLTDAAFSPEDYLVPLPDSYDCIHEHRLMTGVISWTQVGNLEKACRAGVYIKIKWSRSIVSLWLASAHFSFEEALDVCEARLIEEHHIKPVLQLAVAV